MVILDPDGIPTENLMYCKCGTFIGPIEETGPGWYECQRCVFQYAIDSMEAEEMQRHESEKGDTDGPA